MTHPNPHHKVVGIDLSLASTGVAAIQVDRHGHTISVDRIATRPGGGTLTDRANRLRHIVGQLNLWTAGAGLVVIEGPALRLQSGAAHERAGLWWIVAARLIANHTPVAVVPPANRAKYAAGRGNAGKDEVLASVLRRYPQVPVAGHDEADALVLAAMGARWLDQPIEQLPLDHLAAMKGAHWPQALEGAA